MTGVEVNGLARLRAGLGDARDGLTSGLEEPGRRAARLLEAHAERTAPRDRGVLASSHQSTVRAGAVEITNAVKYAKPVHARQPWLTKTLDALTGDVIDLYETHVDQLVDQIRGA